MLQHAQPPSQCAQGQELAQGSQVDENTEFRDQWALCTSGIVIPLILIGVLPGQFFQVRLPWSLHFCHVL